MCRRLGAGWAHPRRLIRMLLIGLAPLAALSTADAAQALTVPALSSASGAAALAGGARSLAGSVAAASSAGTMTTGSAGGVAEQVAAAVQSVRANVSGSVPSSPAPGGSPSTHPAPTVATDPAPVSTPPPVQQTVTTALQRAGVTSGRGESETVPVTAIPPTRVTGTAGPQSESQLLAAVGDLATRHGADPSRLLNLRPDRGALALAGSAGRLVWSPRVSGRRRLPADPHGAPQVDPFGDSLATPVSQLPPTPPAARARPSRAPVVRRHPDPRQASPPAAGPVSQAPLALTPAPNGPASAVGVGGGVGAAAVVLLIIAVIWLVQLVGDRMPLEAWAWRETLLALRLERPG